MLTIGTYKTTFLPTTIPLFECLDKTQRHLLNRPWLQDYLAERLGVAPFDAVLTDNGTVELEEWVCQRPMAVIGKSGGGKTRFAAALATENLRLGCSMVFVLPKTGDLAELLEACRTLGIDPRDVHILDPTAPRTPGWNFNLADLPPYQIASDFVTVVETAITGPAPRLKDLAANAATIIAAHRLSILELIRLLTDDLYRAHVLTLPCAASSTAAYLEAARYFSAEFAAWGKSERATATSPLLNKIRELVRSDYLVRILTSRRNTLELASLSQRRQVVAMSLDRAVLGDQAARMLGALLIHGLYRAALRRPGSVPVCLVLDEVPILEAFLGDVLLDVLRTGRSLGLRTLFIMQEFSAVSAALRSALIGNVSLLAAFAVGVDDARLLAQAISNEPLPRLRRAEVSFEEPDPWEPPVLAETTYPVVDEWGRALTLKSPARDLISVAPLSGQDALTWLLELARHAGLPRLYVKRQGGQMELVRFLVGLDPQAYRFSGPEFSVTVSFPRPKLTGVEKATQSDTTGHWAHTLQNLPIQHCLLKVTGKPPAVIRVRDVRDASEPEHLSRYVNAALMANSLPPKECADSLARREAEIQRVVRGQAQGEADDGSIA